MILKEIVLIKKLFCHHYSLFFLLSSKEDILKNVGNKTVWSQLPRHQYIIKNIFFHLRASK